MSVSSDDFYRELAPFDDALDVCDPRHTTAAPDDWLVCVTDVRGSTQAIEAGRYKEVNLVGAACITAATNAAAGVALPYVFGGDGATILFPAARAEPIERALLAVQVAAAQNCGLELRVGRVPVGELRAAGADTRVGKLRVSEHVSFAMLAGAGPTRAEALIKADPRYQLHAEPGTPPDLTGLECRWQPIAARRATILSGLVHVLPGQARPPAEIYREVIDELVRVAGAHETLNPAGPDTLRVSLNPFRLGAEARLKQPPGRGRLRRLAMVLRLWVIALLGRLLMAFDVKGDGFRWGEYRAVTARHTDYWKYDDTLRFVIDVSASCQRELDELLRRREERGELVYGLHASPTAVMTCIVMDHAGQHIHFVDGGDGGYAMAAKQLKAKRCGAGPAPQPGQC